MAGPSSASFRWASRQTAVDQKPWKFRFRSADEKPPSGEIFRPSVRLDLLRLPLLGRLLHWRWGRLVFQTFFVAVAALVIYDGLTGTQLAHPTQGRKPVSRGVRDLGRLRP
jgi:hypothetical protein